MAYQAEISRKNPGCFLFLVDQSESMEDPFGGGEAGRRKAEELATILNKLLHNLCIRCAKSDSSYDYFHVGVLGYSEDSCKPALGGEPSGRSRVRISELASKPWRIEERAKTSDDRAGGEVGRTANAPHAANGCDIKAFCCPKLGNSLEEYEDAWAHRQTRTPVGIRVAVADGATESSFAKLWAVLLAESYVRSELAGAEFFARLKPARRLWRRRLAGRPLPWFASEKAEQGAFAAFLGVEIDAHKNRWTALAVGDCCLMQVYDVGKGMRAVETFPLLRSSQFTMSPYLIGSRSDGESLKDRIQVSKGSLRDGDMLLLATDAMAAWLLKRHEEGRPLWKWLYRKLGTPENFAAMVAYGRKNGWRNDDFTLVRVIHHDSPVEAKER